MNVLAYNDILGNCVLLMWKNECSCGSVVRALRKQCKGCGFDSQGTHTDNTNV